MHYRIALCGFSEFEHRALHFSFQHPVAMGETVFEMVEALSQADFAVVDADSSPAVKGVVLSGRLAQAVFVGAAAPHGAGAHLPRPIDPERIRRALDELASRLAPPKSRAEPPPDSILPTLEDVVVVAPVPGDSVWPVSETAVFEPAWLASTLGHEVPGPAAPSANAPGPASSPQAEAQRAAKAAARAAARRARLASHADEPMQGEPLRDVLVFDADEVSGAALCELLELFGFTTRWARSLWQAGNELQSQAFAAFFLDIALDGADHGEGLALVQRIYDLPVPAGHPPPAVLIVAAQLNPADRVRAALAGIKAPLVKPVSRGDVARALESCGVTLPADARRR